MPVWTPVWHLLDTHRSCTFVVSFTHQPCGQGLSLGGDRQVHSEVHSTFQVWTAKSRIPFRSQASSAAQGGTGGRGHPSYGVRDPVSSSARNLGALPGPSLLHYPAPILRLAQSQRRSVVIFLSTLDICANPTAPHFPALSLEPSPFSALPEVKESGV